MALILSEAVGPPRRQGRRLGHQRNKKYALLAAFVLSAQMPALMNLVDGSGVPDGQRSLGQGLLPLGRCDRQVECSRLTVGPGRYENVRGTKTSAGLI